jgi:hypothetical protein
LATRIHPGLKLALLLIGIAGVFFAIDQYRHRFVRSDEDLLKLLPGGDATVLYARVDILRKAGFLNLISTNRAGDPDYQAFLRETRFDYRRDIDAIAGSIRETGTLLAVKGSFDWNRIAAYTRDHGGQKGFTLIRIQPDVIGVAIGAGTSLAAEVHPGQNAMPQPLPAEPVWVKLAPHLLKNPSALPVALRIFLISLQSAKSVLVSLAPAPSGSSDAFEIKLDGECESAVAADTAKKQLQIDTTMLKIELAREHQQPNPADLTGLLTAGTFDTSGKEVRGVWPVRKELLAALQ